MDDNVRFLKWAKYFMIFVGHWNFHEKDKLFPILFKRFSLLYYAIMSHLILLTVFKVTGCKDRVIELLCYYIQNMGIIIMSLLFRKSDDIQKVINSMLNYERYHLQKESSKEKIFYDQYCKNSGKVIALFSFFLGYVAIFWYVGAIRNTLITVETDTPCPLIKGILYQICYPFDHHKYFYVILVMDIILLITTLLFRIYCRIMPVMMMIFILGQIKILQDLLNRLGMNDESVDVSDDTILAELKKHIKRHQEIFRYIFSLALADLLVIVTCVPFTSLIYTLDSWPWGVLLCKINESVRDIGIGVSVFTLTALSAERYCAIVNPLRRLQTKPLTVISAAMIWLLATGFALPDAISSRIVYVQVSSNKIISVCSPFPNITNAETYQQYQVVLKSLIYYFIPLGVIAFFYVLMAIRLHHSANEMPGEIKGTQSIAQARARKHVARMVLIFVFLFFICFLPHHIFMLWFHLYSESEDEYNDWWHALKIVGFCLSFINSCVNPIALYCVSGVFRGHFNRYLCCRDPRWPRNALSAANCETSFNSTYRRHTQNTTMDSHSIYRKSNLSRKNMEDANCLTSNVFNKNNANDTVIKNNMIFRSQMDIDRATCRNFLLQ